MEENGQGGLHEEIAYLILHDLIDQIFGGARVECGVGDYDDGDGGEQVPPMPSSPPVISPVRERIAPKRRRLGVNAGAHELIVRLKNTISYVSDERDEMRAKCRRLEAEIRKLETEKEALERQVSALTNVLCIYRRRRAQDQELWNRTAKCSEEAEREQ